MAFKILYSYDLIQNVGIKELSTCIKKEYITYSTEILNVLPTCSVLEVLNKNPD